MPLKMYQEDNKTQGHIQSTIAIAAGKGGVGKSTVAINLALAMQGLGYVVGVLDADIYGPSVRKMLPESSLPAQKGNKIVPAICHQGIRMISMAYFRKEQDAAAVRAPIANGIISQFIRDVEWGPLDYLFIDFPPGTGDIQLTLSQQANLTGAIMVTTPQEISLMDVRKAIHLFEQVRVPVIGIVENMSFYRPPRTREIIYPFGKGGGERLAKDTHVPLLSSIPVDPIISEYGDKGESLFHSQDPECIPIADLFISLAKEVDAEVAHRKTHLINEENFELVWKEME